MKDPGVFVHSALRPHARRPVTAANTHSSMSTQTTHNDQHDAVQRHTYVRDSRLQTLTSLQTHQVTTETTAQEGSGCVRAVGMVTTRVTLLTFINI